MFGFTMGDARYALSALWCARYALSALWCARYALSSLSVVAFKPN
jgi:hypothetical protein